MTVQAKVRCIGNSPPQNVTNGAMQTARFTPVSDVEGSNAEWSKWTPYGYIELAITNPDAFGQFTPGAEYLLTFEQAAVHVQTQDCDGYHALGRECNLPEAVPAP